LRIWRRLTGRSGKASDAAERRRRWLEQREQERRERSARADAWLAAGPPTVERIAAEYEARLALLDEELRPWARPVAAWRLRDGEPRVESSRMGGRPPLYAGEQWPGGDDPMRFWAQVNLADLAPFARAYGVALPTDGLVQLFAGDEGGELARYIPAGELGGLELCDRVPIGPLWADSDDAQEVHHRTLLISLYPEALVPWQETSPIIFRDDDIDAPLPCTTSEELPGYSFGWWPFSSWGLEDGLDGWPPDRPKPPPEDWVFLAVCDSNDHLGLQFSDAGFLWATIPAADLAAGDFTQLRCDGESS
jgi:uncharacterized protein DUF1963